jgi:hypothetical protein
LAPSWVNCTPSSTPSGVALALTRRTESKLIFVLNKDGIPLDFFALHFEIDVVNVG